MPFLDEAQPETRPRGGRFIDEEPPLPFPGLPQTSDLTDRMADAASRGYRFYRQSELLKEGTPQAEQEISRLQGEIESIPRGPGIERFQQAKGWRESFRAIADDPVNTIGELVAESMGSLVPKAIQTIPAAAALGAGAGFTLGGPAGVPLGVRGGFIAGTGITSGSLEYSGKILESLQEAGVDIRDPEQLHNAFTNPTLMENVRNKAVRKAVPIAVFDALSAGLAGRFLSRPAASLIGRVGQTGAEVGTQMATSGIGEAAGELAAGEKISPPSILAEMLLEPVAGAPEIATGVATRPRATRRIGEPLYATTQREVPKSDQQQYQPPQAQGVPTETSSGDRIQPSGPIATQTQEEIRPETQAQLTRSAPVTFLQVQEGMPELVWYRLNEDITSPDGRVYPAGKNISNGELARFGYAVPESEAKKALPVQLPTIGRFEIPGTPAEQYETVLQTIRNANANTKAKIQALFPRAELSREQAQSLRNLAFPETKEVAQTSFNIDAGPTVVPISRFDVDEAVTNFKRQYPGAPTINVVNSEDELPPEALAAKPSPTFKIRAVTQRFDDGTAAIWLVANRLRSPQMVQSDLAHEIIAHYGLHTLMGNDLRLMNQAVATRFKGTPEFQELVSSYGNDPNIVGEEIIARIAQNPDQDLNLWQQIVAAIQKWWRENINPNRAISDLEIRRALMRSRRFLQQQPAVEYREFSPEGDLINAYAGEEQTELPLEESPFDRMRRESGAEPPPELTPEQKAARERNERIRGRRPETLFAGEDDEGKPTNVFGVTDYITERPVLTPEQLASGRAHAKTIFDQAGLDVLEDDEMDGWRLVYTGEKQNAAGHKLIDLLTRELATQHQAGKPQLAPLINNIRLNFKYGTMDQLFDLPVRLKLYSLSQGEASRRGMELRALAGLPEDITFVAQNIDVELQHIYSDMFGGKEIQQFLDKTKEATVKKIDKPVQDGVLAGKPEMQQEVDKANAARDPSAKIPNAQQLANEVFKQPFDSFDDLVNALKDRLMKEFKLSDADATKIARKFKDTFEKPFKDAAQKSYEEVRKALGQIIGSRKGIWDKIQKAINKGVFDNIQVLREVAQAMGMRPPTEEEIKKMKALAAREREMGSLTPKELEEHKKMGTTPEKLKEAMDARLASTNIPRSQIRKQMEVLWTRFTKPIPGLSIDSWRGFKHTRRNLAAAINEFISANLLFKLGFPSRLGISVFSQWLVNTPTRAIANALVRYHDAIAKGQQTSLYKDMAMHLGDSYRAQYNALVPALESARAALLGRGEARNIDRLMSGIAAMDRIASKAKEYWDAGDYGRGSLLWMLAQIRMGYRVAQSMDNLQGVPAEYSEMRARVINELLGKGMPRAEALNRADFVIGDMKQQHMEAVADTKKAWEATGITGSANELSESAWDLVKQKQYQRIKELGLPADEFRDQIKFYRNVLAWNEAEHKGIGGGIARLLQRVEHIAEQKGIPTAITRFSNAIGITINRALAFTPFYKQADYGGYGTSGWFKTETDKQQRRVEAWLGSTVGVAAFMLALSGMWLVRRKWPKDKEEQDLWQQEGHRPGTVEIPVGDGSSFISMSLNNSPLMFVAPYLAAGGALHDLLLEREGQQKKLNDEAAKTGATPGKIRPMSFGDMALVALEGAKQAIIGGRTPAATLASVTYYGLPNAKKLAASYASPLVPGLPALQEVSRMAGVALDERFASVWDFMLPLPGSEARRLNMLGDPVKTPNDIQRITQIMTGGNYPLPVDAAEAKSKPAYDALFNSGYRPPSINPAKGYQIGTQYRPMNNAELDKYIELRGRYLKEGLIGTGPYIDKAAAQKVYEDANQRALSEVGVLQPVKTSSTPRTTTTRRTGARGPRRVRGRGGRSLLRRPRTRRISYRRPRLTVRRLGLRRIRRLAA